eukprot:TRINITY_DN5823_c0_g1_i3.p1 TRINITY_DN5823_c0_g1~~TRINITY_DN5823_c0_g1_i3.p1  ORF type:complete len:895 (-),score=333.63 TRINITY_DN5823_c0_g1_i3:1083-3767(-)
MENHSSSTLPKAEEHQVTTTTTQEDDAAAAGVPHIMTMSLPNNINNNPVGNTSPSSPPPAAELEKGLRILENRLQKISHLPKPTKSLLPKPDLKIPKSHKSVKLQMNIPSPISEIGGLSTSSSNSMVTSSSSATAPTTSSMLKSTLKRMSRVSTATTLSSNASNKPPLLDNASPKRRSVRSSPPLARSKSFKEPQPRPGSSSSSSSTGSLRRPTRKDHPPDQMSRCGTAGNLAKRSQSMRRLRDKDVLIRKSRGVQTQLTKDGSLSECGEDETSILTALDFTVYLPDILGSGEEEGVETIVSEHKEPPDVRKNRQLTLDNMKLHREVDRLKSQVSDNESLKRELKSVRGKLEEEQKARLHIEAQLDEHNDKVQCIVRSMDTVEREFESRTDNMLQLESRCSAMQAQLSESQRVINEKRQELLLKSNEYKTLLSRFEEAEMETSELQEFLQAEKSTLAEDFKEREVEISALNDRLSAKESERGVAEERCLHLVRLGEQRHQEVLTLEAQLNTVQEKAKEMILSQGAEISRASIAFAQLSAKLEALFNNFSNHSSSSSNLNNNNNIQHVSNNNGLSNRLGSFDEEDSSLSSNLSSPSRKLGGIPRSASNFLVTPPSAADEEESEDLVGSFNRAMMTVSLFGAENLNNNNTNINNNAATTNEGHISSTSSSLQNLSAAIDQRKKSQESGGLLSEASDISSNSSLPSLVDRICDITNLIDKYNLNLRNMCNCNRDETKESEPDSNGHVNGHTPALTSNQDLNKIISEKETEISELRKNCERMLKHREILQSNWKSTEAEVHEMDSLYTVTVENVLNVLRSHPELVGAHVDFLHLQKKMETALLDDKGGRKANNATITTSSSSSLPETCAGGKKAGASLLTASFIDPSNEEDINANQSL